MDDDHGMEDEGGRRTEAEVYAKFSQAPARVLVNAPEGRTKVELSIHCFSGDTDTMVRKREVTKRYTSRGTTQTWGARPSRSGRGRILVDGPDPDDFESGFCSVEAEASAGKGQLHVRLQRPTEG